MILLSGKTSHRPCNDGEEGLTHRASPVDRAQCHNCLALDLTHTRTENLDIMG